MTGTRIRVKNVERWRDRHGKVRLYYRVYPGPRISLRGPEGSSEFWEDYLAAAGDAKKEPEGPASLRWLVQRYYTSAAYKGMRASTRRVRCSILDRFCDSHGHKRFAQLQPRHLREIRDGMADRPETTFGTMNDDVLAHFDPDFHREDFVRIIQENAWPE